MYFNLKQCPAYLSTSSALKHFYRKPPYSSAMTSISVIAERTDNTGNKIHSISSVSSHKFHSYILESSMGWQISKTPIKSSVSAAANRHGNPARER